MKERKSRDPEQTNIEEARQLEHAQRRQSHYIRKFSKRRWSWRGTLCFPRGCTRHTAERMFRRWIRELQKAEGTKNFRWVRVRETNPFGDPHRFLVLVGGLRNPARIAAKHWSRNGGEAYIHRFRSSKGEHEIGWMLKGMIGDDDFDLVYKLR